MLPVPNNTIYNQFKYFVLVYNNSSGVVEATEVRYVYVDATY